MYQTIAQWLELQPTIKAKDSNGIINPEFKNQYFYAGHIERMRQKLVTDLRLSNEDVTREDETGITYDDSELRRDGWFVFGGFKIRYGIVFLLSSGAQLPMPDPTKVYVGVDAPGNWVWQSPQPNNMNPIAWVYQPIPVVVAPPVNIPFWQQVTNAATTIGYDQNDAIKEILAWVRKMKQSGAGA